MKIINDGTVPRHLQKTDPRAQQPVFFPSYWPIPTSVYNYIWLVSLHTIDAIPCDLTIWFVWAPISQWSSRCWSSPLPVSSNHRIDHWIWTIGWELDQHMPCDWSPPFKGNPLGFPHTRNTTPQSAHSFRPRLGSPLGSPLQLLTFLKQLITLSELVKMASPRDWFRDNIDLG